MRNILDTFRRILKYLLILLSEEFDKRPVVVINGNNNQNVGLEVYYIYNEEQFKRLLPSSKERLKDYIVTPGISAHKLNPRKLTWNKARQACIQEGGKKK